MRFPAFRTQPSRMFWTGSASEIAVMFCSFRRNAHEVVWAITVKPGILASRFRISAARPSLKYSLSLSALMLAKGKTAMDEDFSEGLLIARSIAERTSAMLWKRSAADLRRQRAMTAEIFGGA